jgi:hypothetical protein
VLVIVSCTYLFEKEGLIFFQQDNFLLLFVAALVWLSATAGMIVRYYYSLLPASLTVMHRDGARMLL